MRTVALIIFVVVISGCTPLIEALGYTVVDEELQSISATRDDFTQEYIASTLPLVEASSKEPAEKERLTDMGKTLSRVSRKERALIVRDIE